jgi:hypothetical protein
VPNHPKKRLIGGISQVTRTMAPMALNMLKRTMMKMSQAPSGSGRPNGGDILGCAGWKGCVWEMELMVWTGW